MSQAYQSPFADKWDDFGEYRRQIDIYHAAPG